MSAGSVVGGVTIPLSADARTYYEDLYVKAQAAVEATADMSVLTGLDAARANIGALLSADNYYRLNQNTVAYQDLLTKFNKANDGLTELAGQIGDVTKRMQLLASVVDGIGKVVGKV